MIFKADDYDFILDRESFAKSFPILNELLIHASRTQGLIAKADYTISYSLAVMVLVERSYRGLSKNQRHMLVNVADWRANIWKHMRPECQTWWEFVMEPEGKWQRDYFNRMMR